MWPSPCFDPPPSAVNVQTGSVRTQCRAVRGSEAHAIQKVKREQREENLAAQGFATGSELGV